MISGWKKRFFFGSRVLFCFPGTPHSQKVVAVHHTVLFHAPGLFFFPSFPPTSHPPSLPLSFSLISLPSLLSSLSSLYFCLRNNYFSEILKVAVVVVVFEGDVMCMCCGFVFFCLLFSFLSLLLFFLSLCSCVVLYAHDHSCINVVCPSVSMCALIAVVPSWFTVH